MERIVNQKEEKWIVSEIMWEKEKDEGVFYCGSHMESENAITFLCNLFTELQEGPMNFQAINAQNASYFASKYNKIGCKTWTIFHGKFIFYFQPHSTSKWFKSINP